jgi:hypothetical protein
LLGIEEELAKPRKVVHIFPHSHTDEGWLARTDDFFNGDDTSIYQGSVRDILDSSIKELLQGNNRTFTYAEIKYFKMWYFKQGEEMQT